MKRLLWLLPVLLLCGCTALPPEETVTEPTGAPTVVTEATEPLGLYVPTLEPEIATGGALRCYLPQLPDTYGMGMVNGDVLLFSGTEVTTLTRYTGEELIPVGQITLECYIEPEEVSFQTSEYGITYYDPGTNNLVFLDNELEEVKRLELAGDLTGQPVLSADRTRIYYCTADAVRVFDTGAGLDRLLKSITYAEQTVEGVLIRDNILRCGLTDAQGEKSVLFLSTQTGATVAQIRQDVEVVSCEDDWYAEIRDGLLKQVLFGVAGETGRALDPADPFSEPWILENTASVLTVSQKDSGLGLELYNLDSGLRTAAVKLSNDFTVIAAEAAEDSIYLLVSGNPAADPMILRWDWSRNPTGDERNCTGERYTLDNPNEEGLAACADLAREIGETYGLKILVGPEAAQKEPWDYSFTYEHQVPLLNRELEALEEMLGRFPKDFFRKLYGQTTICIVRSITGSAASGSLEQAKGVQFWDGERAYVVLAVGEGLQQSFCHELFHIIDSKVLSTTRVYYHWENLNPQGCKYFENYTSWQTADVSQYLEGENRAFIDAYSMSYPREDRARIMEYACMPENEDYFQSEIMQNKLKTLCQGIREAFGLKNSTESFLWEQYLKEPITK